MTADRGRRTAEGKQRAVVGRRWSVVGIALLLALAACDAAGPEAFEAQYVVESYQVAGEPLAEVRLSRTAPVDATYDFNELAVSGAEVAVELLDEDGGTEARYLYRENPDTVGVYEAVDPVPAEPLRTYRLEVDLPETDEARLSATTIVPDTFRVVRAEADTVVFGSPEQAAFTLTKSQYPGRRQSYYRFTTETLLEDPAVEDLTPIYQRLYEEADGDIALSDFFTASSPILNEANYTEQADGTLTIRLPWLAVAFYGPIRVEASALDDNLYDFFRSQSVQQGGSTFSPGEIPNVLDHVEGGTGVFGSLARQDYVAFIRRPESQ